MIETAAASAPRHRPRAVTVVGWLLCGEALLLLLLGSLNTLSLALAERIDLDMLGALARDGNDLLQVRLPILTALTGTMLLVAGVGLLRMRAWAWLLAMAIEAISLAVALRLYVLGEPHFGPMAIGSLIVLALNQREVRQAFVRHVDTGH